MEISAETVEGISELYESLRHLRPVLPIWLRMQIPQALRRSFLTLEYWQWIGLFIVIFGGMVFDYTARIILRTVSRRLIVRQGVSEPAEAVRLAVRLLGLLAAAILWVIFLRGLALPETAAKILLGAARIFGILAGTWAAWLRDRPVSEILVEKSAQTATKLDDVLIPLVCKTIKIFIVAMGVIYGANSLNVEIMLLLASLGIGGVAFAFAAKDTVENFFGSVAVLLDRPFEVGDWVIIENHEGTVEEVSFRSTRIRTFYNSQITVPNANLVRAIVDNYGRRQYRRWKTHIGVQYDTPSDKLVAFTEGISELVRCRPYTRKDYFQVRMHQFGPHSLDILLYIFHDVPDWSTELREREHLFIDIVRMADRLGVQFAFPTQTLHLYKEEHRPHQVQHDIPPRDAERDAEMLGIRTAQQLVREQSWQKEKPGPVAFTGGGDATGGAE